MTQKLGELIPCGGGNPIPLLKTTLLIGRRNHCDITLQFPNVSSQHCELTFENGYWKIRDLGSANGIKVNNNRCESKWLQPGDIVTVAKHRYEIQYEASGPAPVEASGEVMSMSLLEKAGIEKPLRRPKQRKSDREIDSKKTLESREKKPVEYDYDSGEDEALKWLMDD
ncbi:FHA domain-containing protein [Thalassoroseus pseudoceratinae]|uniref:FHA domain-containing protein n=1 Tax=Thalassoroseus pseudoceratinae TaxID=2713176 RepID=UPI0014243657|nr:FHA domain-containing protein [Thalassoroseus pseudoceratinae]